MMQSLAAAAVEEDRGWGGPVAVLIAVVLFVAIVRGPGWVRTWRASRPVDEPDGEDDDGGEGYEDDGQEQVSRSRLGALGRSIAAALWDRQDPDPLPSPTDGGDDEGYDQGEHDDGDDREGKWIVKRYDWGAISYPPGTRVQPARPPRRRR